MKGAYPKGYWGTYWGKGSTQLAKGKSMDTDTPKSKLHLSKQIYGLYYQLLNDLLR